MGGFFVEAAMRFECPQCHRQYEMDAPADVAVLCPHCAEAKEVPSPAFSRKAAFWVVGGVLAAILLVAAGMAGVAWLNSPGRPVAEWESNADKVIRERLYAYMIEHDLNSRQHVVATTDPETLRLRSKEHLAELIRKEYDHLPAFEVLRIARQEYGYKEPR